MINLLDTSCFSFAKPNKANNEDAFLAPIYSKQSDIVFAISDGVGSHDGAAKASHHAINAIKLELEEENFNIKSAFLRAKKAVDVISSVNNKYRDAATTLTVVQVSESHITIGHIGDCRAYYLYNNKLIQLTKDETRYQELIDTNKYSSRQLREHKHELSSILTNAISRNIDLDVTINRYEYRELCNNGVINLTLMSDGAYDHWDKRPRFSELTMNNPSAFSNSLRKRIEKEPLDDYSLVNVKIISEPDFTKT